MKYLICSLFFVSSVFASDLSDCKKAQKKVQSSVCQAVLSPSPKPSLKPSILPSKSPSPSASSLPLIEIVNPVFQSPKQITIFGVNKTLLDPIFFSVRNNSSQDIAVSESITSTPSGSSDSLSTSAGYVTVSAGQVVQWDLRSQMTVQAGAAIYSVRLCILAASPVDQMPLPDPLQHCVDGIIQAVN